MTIDAWLPAATSKLSDADIATARLDALVLLEDLLQTDRALLLAHPETELNGAQIAVLDTQLARRAGHEPLAYIRGHAEFYGRVFMVDKNVLIPRPESEMMIELLKKCVADKPTIVDIGTGSGALAITAKLELPTADVFGIDIDPNCIAVAQKNAALLQADIGWIVGDVLEPLRHGSIQPDILLCNLPYVPDAYAINQAAGHEPRLALFSGPDGLDHFRKLFAQLPGMPRQPHAVLTESLPEQHAALAAIAAAVGYSLQASDDFIQVFTA